MTTRALIVDDHPIVRGALVTSLLSLGVFDEVDTAKCFQDLVEMLEKDPPYQILILDLSLTDTSGSAGVLQVREQFPDIPILVFSASDSPDVIAECFEFGVHGFVSKSTSMQVFVNAIRIVLSGGIYIPPSAASMMGFEPVIINQLEDDDAVAAEERVHFTPKQREVYDQLMLGVPNKIIARRLDMAEGTVKTHLHSIYQLLRVSSRAQAILKSRQIQIV
ncbi:MAG: response regulator transcription factor [Halioglobus sp.]